MSTAPTPPKSPTGTSVSDETEKTIRERLKTLEDDRKTAKPWPEVKARILQQPKPR